MEEVFLVINSLGSGGAEKQILFIARALSRSGFHCSINVLQRRDSNTMISELMHECETLGVKFLQPKTKSLVSQGVNLACLVYRIGLLRNRVIWSWGTRTDLLCKLVSRRSRSNTLICSLRLASEKAITSRIWSFKWREHLVDFYVSNSQRNIDLLQKHANISNSKFHILPNVVMDVGRSEKHNSQSSSRLSKLCVGVLGNNHFWHKGYDTLLRAATLIKKAGYPIRFEVGGNDYNGSLQSKIQELNVSSLVKSRGAINDPISFLREHDAYLLTSRVEGTPNALLEAMCLGIPSISTRVGDLESIFSEREHLLLIDSGAPQQIVDALLQMLDDWPSACEMGRKGRRFVKAYFSETAAAKRVHTILSNSPNFSSGSCQQD